MIGTVICRVQRDLCCAMVCGEQERDFVLSMKITKKNKQKNPNKKLEQPVLEQYLFCYFC